MTITSSGVICDVCGKYILGLIPEDMIYPFRCKGIIQQLHSCYKCKKILLEIGTDWTKLPDGPLRKAFDRKGTCIKRE